MPNAKYFASKAQRCRELLKFARAPEVVEQLRLWAADFDAEARDRTRRKRDGASILRHRARHLRA